MIDGKNLSSPDGNPQLMELLDDRERHQLYPEILGSIATRRLVRIPEESTEDPSPYDLTHFPLDLSLKLTNAIDRLKADQRREGIELPEIFALRIDIDHPYADIARYHEARIFKDEWYVSKEPGDYAATHEEEFHNYENASRFILVLDTSRYEEDGSHPIAGLARMVDGQKAPLKTVEDMPEIWDKNPEEIMSDLRNINCEWYEMTGEQRSKSGFQKFTWDISSLAVDKNYRNDTNNIYAVISHEMSVWALEEGVHTWTTVLVTKFFNLYTKFKGIPFRSICGVEEAEHMEAMSIPAVLHLYELPAMKSDPKNSRAMKGFKELVQGEGLVYTAAVI